MAADLPAQRIVDIALSLLRQTSVQNTQEFSDEQILMWASQAGREMQRQAALANKELYYETIAFDMVAGQQEYDLEALTTRTIRKLVRLRRMDALRPFVVRKVQGGWVAFERYEAAYPNPSINPRVQVAKLNGNKLWIAPVPSATVEDAFEALYEAKIVPDGGFTDLANDELAPTPEEWVDFAGWWMAYLATQQDEETGETFKNTALTMLQSLRSDASHEFRGEPRLAVPLEDGEDY